jgi:preprotein translocase subunit SecA
MAEADDLRQFEVQAQEAREFAQATERRTGEELSGQTMAFRGRLADGGRPSDLVPEALACVREAAQRAVGTPLTDAQLAGGAAVHAGLVVEMKDGEGKTLTAVLAAYLHALSGQGVHVVTLDDQLARRGAGQATNVLSLLGLRVGTIDAGSSTAKQAQAYAADVTYAAYRHFADDYLRDNLAWALDERVQRGQHAAVLDEIDSILIDKASELLGMTGRVEPDVIRYRKLAQLVAQLRGGLHYSLDAATGVVNLTEPGVAEAEAALSLSGLQRPEHASLAGLLADAIRAREWYRQGQDYVVMDGEVVVAADQRNGRLSRTIRFDRGIRQAIEACEGLHISPEEPVLARVSVAGYFRSYRSIAGLTATATASAAEFDQNFGLAVAHAPLGLPTRRVDHSDLIYRTQQAKLHDLIRSVSLRHDTGQPVAIGAPSAGAGERISQWLRQAGIAHTVLSQRTAQNAAAMMAGAGGRGAVTVICGTAGRGYPVRLGGDATADSVNSQQTSPQAAQAAAGSRQATGREHVLKAGGLAVLGSERSPSRRADEWLRGLAGQRGEPGESRFLISMDDPFMNGLHGGGLLGALRRSRPQSHGARVTGLMRRLVDEHLQGAEAQAAQARHAIAEYEKVSDQQSGQTYRMRRAILEAGDLRAHTRAMIAAVIEASVAANPDPLPLRDSLAALYPISLTAAELTPACDEPTAAAQVTARVKADALTAYEHRERELSPAVLRELERKLMLGVIDREWREHISDLDRLREQGNAGSYRHDDPLGDYRHSAAQRYSDFLRRVSQQTVSNLYFLEISL